MFLPELVVRGRRILTPEGIRPGAIHVRNGRIIGVLGITDHPSGCPVDDAGDDVVLPGLVDTSVQVTGSGRSSPEEFESATHAAALGGVTTIITMLPEDSSLSSSVAALSSTCRDAEGHCFVDVGFWGRVIPEKPADLQALFEAGILGFGCSLVKSGAGNCPAVSEAELRAVMPALARVGAPLVVHAELPGPIEQAAADQRTHRTWVDRIPGFSRVTSRYSTYLESRPKAAENEAVAFLIGLCQEYRIPTHIVHLSSSDALTPIFHARSRGLPVTAGTCPHYLTLVAEEIPDHAVEFKCAPPIRERANREFLWAALAGGIIQSVSSDHRPAPVMGSRRGFLEAPAGIASLQLGLPVVWTEARLRGVTIDQVVRWMSHAPAQLAGLTRKGLIDVGYDADLVVFDPDAELTVEAEARQGQRASTPYHGRSLRGAVRRTYVRGACVQTNGTIHPNAAGRLLLRR